MKSLAAETAAINAHAERIHHAKQVLDTELSFTDDELCALEYALSLIEQGHTRYDDVIRSTQYACPGIDIERVCVHLSDEYFGHRDYDEVRRVLYTPEENTYE